VTPEAYEAATRWVEEHNKILRAQAAAEKAMEDAHLHKCWETHKGITHVIGQLNNAMLYPGVGLGAIVSRARSISVGMLMAAASALSSLVAVRLAGATLLPHIEDLRRVTVVVAVAVAEAAVREGLAGVRLADIVQQVEDAMWQPEYRRIEAS
jgi:malate dehydrogenase (oxaloacetate-decarboxylating)